MEIRKVNKEEIPQALDLVWRTFMEYEAPDYSEEGVKEFKKAIDDKEWVSLREFYGAFDESRRILGVIATKDKTHIALFFVEGSYQGNGIGRKLYEKIKEFNESGYFTVNSSIYAHEIYKHFGFIDTDKEQVINGLRFYPMMASFQLDKGRE